MESLWQGTTSKMPHFERLRKDIKTDVLIIGGGMAGILCAYMLKQAGVDYTLVEGETICNGVTKNTTAKITSQHGLIYNKLIKEFNVEKAKLYFEANQEALNKYRELCTDISNNKSNDKKIDCHFENKNSFVYSTDNFMKIEKELVALEKIGCYSGFANFTDELPLAFPVAGAIEFKNQAQFNPLQFVASISKDLTIYEHTFITEIDLNEKASATGPVNLIAKFDEGRIIADRIIVATHFPFINKHGSYFVKMYQERSYVIAIAGKNKEETQKLQVDGMYLDEAEKGMSFRNYDDLLLVGGGDHRTGKSGGNWKELRMFIKNNYPNTVEKYWWATQDCMTLDSVPYIGSYSKKTPNLYVATGFNKWGMSTSMVAATLLTDIITGKKSKYESLFSTTRSMVRPQLFVNAFDTTVDMLIPTTRRCPHLGCALRRNYYEHTWDCPCHGSRFTDDGNIIDNPAMHNLK